MDFRVSAGWFLLVTNGRTHNADVRAGAKLEPGSEKTARSPIICSSQPRTCQNIGRAIPEVSIIWVATSQRFHNDFYNPLSEAL